MNVKDLAKRIPEKCLEAVLSAYEDAGILELCTEGCWQAAASALRTLDLAPLARELTESGVELSSSGSRVQLAPDMGLRITARQAAAVRPSTVANDRPYHVAAKCYKPLHCAGRASGLAFPLTESTDVTRAPKARVGNQHVPSHAQRRHKRQAE